MLWKKGNCGYYPLSLEESSRVREIVYGILSRMYIIEEVTGQENTHPSIAQHSSGKICTRENLTTLEVYERYFVVIICHKEILCDKQSIIK